MISIQSRRFCMMGLLLVCLVREVRAEEIEFLPMPAQEAPSPSDDKGTIGIACMDSEGRIYSPDRDPEAYETCVKQRELQAPSG